MTYLSHRSFLLDVSAGLVPGYTYLHKFGRNDDIDLATDPEGVWSQGGTFLWPASASVLDVSSGSANDTSAGSGARTVTIQGLDATGAEVEETKSLNGLSVVTTSATFQRVNRAFVATVGTYHGNNNGAITIQQTGGGDVLGHIAPSIGQTQQCKYTVPLGKELLLYGADIWVDSNIGNTRMIVFHKPDFTSTNTGARRVVHDWDGVSGAMRWDPGGVPQPFAALTDIWVRAQLVSANNMNISAEFYGVIRTL